ncbi:MAG TPA: ATP-binding protein [Kofleriaceae bacterium]|nr:ATP-binding protein [Kofleriaceae bacterium]
MTGQPRVRLAPDALVGAPLSAARNPSRGAYVNQQALIDDQLFAIRHRLRAAAEHVALASEHEHAPSSWPSDLLALEERVGARVRASGDLLPTSRVRDRFALTPTEERVLWILIAHELCPIARQMIRGLVTEQVSDPTTDVLRRVVYGQRCGPDIWRELGEEGALRRYCLVERVDQAPDVPEHRQTWRITRRMLALVHGRDAIDSALAELAVVEADATDIRELELAGDALERLAQAFDHGDLVLAHGGAGSGRRSALVAVARARGLDVLRIEGRALAKQRDVAHQQLQWIARECRLSSLTPLIRDLDALGASGEVLDRLDLVERTLPGLVLATALQPIARRWARTLMPVEVGGITGAQRAALWRRAVPAAGAGDAEVLATMYPISPALISSTGRLAVEQCGPDRMKPEHITSALRAVLDHRLAGLARRISVTQTWEDLVLPDDQSVAIAELLARIRERTRVYEEWGFAGKVGRGLGVSALFSGPPGTGKTMAAGLVARALGVELYQVDLSKVVSKWLGETEKNLAALFDAAEAGHAILLFDEADALFGKRTDVRSSNDRYANQEVNFLLQRMESYGGICVLTTNHESAIDDAFRRRLAVHIRFPMPETDERARLWAAMIPKAAPRSAELGISALAERFVMSGGYIRNAVLRAAFLAADEDGVIDAPRLLRAAQLEYEALGKVVAANP